MILGQIVSQSMRPLEILAFKSRNSPFALRLHINWVFKGTLPFSLSLPFHCLKYSVEDNLLVEQVKTWGEFDCFGT